MSVAVLLAVGQASEVAGKVLGFDSGQRMV